MRPFKFFFLVSIGFLIFFSLMKVVFIALIFAGIMSLIFFGLKTIASFFRTLTWESERHTNHINSLDYPEFSFQTDSPNMDWDSRNAPWEKEKVIRIR